MRVLLWSDMEGMSRIATIASAGRYSPVLSDRPPQVPDEVVAAATGLLHDGANAVFVVNWHGLGWPNVPWDELPEPVAPTDNNAWSEGFDAMFQIGFHARAGTANGFVGHTMVPGLRVAVDGAPVTECQIRAWLAGLPLPYGEANRTPGSCSVSGASSRTG
jgi:D-amino peptidase